MTPSAPQTEETTGAGVTQHHARMDSFPFSKDMERCTIVLPEHRVLFVPVPKAAWTSILRMLLRPAGLTPEMFSTSYKPEVTLDMAIHDKRVWGQAGRTLESLPDEVRVRALTEDGWFRFSVVRDPATRLWSAWQCKLLLREPSFVNKFGDQPWFPRVPQTPHDVLEDFRRFVESVREQARHQRVPDKHWAPQHLLVERIPLTHVGQVERLSETYDSLRAHLGSRADLTGSLTHDNRAPLPYSPALYDGATAAAVRTLYGEDFARFGYAPVDGSTDAEALAAWERHVDEALPALRELIARHERLGAYHRRLGAIRAQSKARSRRNQELKHKLAARTRQRDKLRRQLDARDRSWSWRLTKPLRAARRLRRRD